MTQVLGYDSALEAILRMFREDPDLFAFLEVVWEDGPEVSEVLEDWK